MMCELGLTCFGRFDIRLKVQLDTLLNLPEGTLSTGSTSVDCWVPWSVMG